MAKYKTEVEAPPVPHMFFEVGDVVETPSGKVFRHYGQGRWAQENYVSFETSPGGVVRLAAGEHDPLAGNGLDVAPPGCGTVLIDWDGATIGAATSGWTVTNDPSRTYAGKTALRIVATAEAATTLVCPITVPPTFFGGAKRITYAVDPGDPAVTGGTGREIQLWLNYSESKTHRIKMAVNGSYALGEWFDSGALYYGEINDTNPGNHIGGTAEWGKVSTEDVQTITLVMSKPTGVAIDIPVYVGPIVSDPIRDPRPIISLFMDGQYSGQWKYARPLFQALGLRASMAIVLPWVQNNQPGTIPLADLVKMYEGGHEFIYHTGAGATVGWDDVIKYPDGHEYALIRADIEGFWGWLRELGATRGLGYGVVPYTNGLDSAQPYSRRMNISRALRDAGMLGVRQLSSFQGSFYGCGGERQTLITKSVIMSSGTTASSITDLVEKIKSHGGWSGISMHDIVMSGASGNDINFSTLKEVAEKLAAEVEAGKLRVLPFSDAMRAIRASARPA